MGEAAPGIPLSTVLRQMNVNLHSAQDTSPSIVQIEDCIVELTMFQMKPVNAASFRSGAYRRHRDDERSTDALLFQP